MTETNYNDTVKERIINKKMVASVLLVALVIIGSFFLGRQTAPSKYPQLQSKETIQPTQPVPEKTDIIMEIQNQQHEERDRKKQENLALFQNGILKQHPDLQDILKEMEILQLEEFIISPSNTTAWVIGTIDKSYLENGQLSPTDKPRHQYLVTTSYWQDMQGPLEVECSTTRVFPTLTYNETIQDSETKTILVSWSCSIAPYVSLFELEAGKKIPLFDLNNLISENPSFIINENGDASGLMEPSVFGKKPIFVVNYGHAQKVATGIFSAHSGQLLDLIVYSRFTEE